MAARKRHTRRRHTRGQAMIGKLAMGVGALIAVLAATMAARTFMMTSRDIEVPPPTAITIDSNAAAARLAEAVRFRTVSRGPDTAVQDAAFRGLHEFLARSFPLVQAALQREVIGGYSLLYTWRGSDPKLKPVLLMGHMDVVPVEDDTESAWTQAPFSGAITDGAIWGRGTLDDKISVLATLEAVEYLLAQGVTPKRTVYLAFGHDEEIGGTKGAGEIAATLAKRGVRLDFTLDEGSIVAEGIVPGVAPPVALIGLAEKGYVSLELTAKAKGGHSSMPPKQTAIGKLARAIDRLQTNPFPTKLQPPASETFEYLAPKMPLALRAVLANRWLLDPILLSELENSPATNAVIRTTTAPTMIGGGIKDNVLPSEATAVINFRILPGETIDTVLRRVLETIDDPDVSVRQFGDGNDPSPVSDSTSASFAAVQRTVRQALPDTIVAPSLVVAGTDSKHYGAIADNSFRFLPIRLGLDDLGRIHGTDERIMISNYAETIRFYVQLLRNTAL